MEFSKNLFKAILLFYAYLFIIGSLKWKCFDLACSETSFRRPPFQRPKKKKGWRKMANGADKKKNLCTRIFIKFSSRAFPEDNDLIIEGIAHLIILIVKKIYITRATRDKRLFRPFFFFLHVLKAELVVGKRIYTLKNGGEGAEKKTYFHFPKRYSLRKLRFSGCGFLRCFDVFPPK